MNTGGAVRVQSLMQYLLLTLYRSLFLQFFNFRHARLSESGLEKPIVESTIRPATRSAVKL